MWTNDIQQNIRKYPVYPGIRRRKFLVPHNTIMDLNDVMLLGCVNMCIVLLTT